MTSCILCGTDNDELLFRVNGCRILRCRDCGLIKTEKKGLISYQDYHRDQDYQKFEKEFRNIFQKRFKIISRFKKKPAKVLEIGAATGVMLQIFKKHGWEVWGIEPSASARDAQKKGIKILKTTFEKAKLPKNYFDVVILNHTLEHMTNPLAIMRKVKTLLIKKGIIYVDVPNFASFSAKLANKNWKYILPEEHLYHFTPETLRKILEKAGFKTIYCRTWSGIFDVANPFLKLYQELADFRLNFINDILGIPANIIATTLNQGTSLAMIGEKIDL